MLRRSRDRIAGICPVKAIAQPTLENRAESEIGLGAIENLGSRINRRLDRIGAQKRMTKAVNGR